MTDPTTLSPQHPSRRRAHARVSKSRTAAAGRRIRPEIDCLDSRTLLSGSAAVDFSSAIPITLNTFGTQSNTTAFLADPTDVVDFSFVAPITGTIGVTGDPNQDTFPIGLQAFNSAQQPITSGFSGNLALSVVAGQTYYLETVGDGVNTGFFTLDFNMGNLFATAQSLSLSALGSQTTVGSITTPGGSSLYVFPSPISGKFSVGVAASGSGLNADAFVYDQAGNLLASTVGQPGSTRSVTVPVALLASSGKNAYYFVQVAAQPGSQGAYALTSSFGLPSAPPGPSDLAQFTPIPFSSSGTANLTGTIDARNPNAVYRFVAPFSGEVAVQLNAEYGNALDPVLYAFDGSQRFLTVDDDGAGGVNSVVRFNVAEGQTYYLDASSFAGTKGDYQLNVSYQPTFDASTFLALSTLVSSGSTVVSNTLAAPGDEMGYSFTAPFTGAVTLEANPGAGSTLQPVLYAFDGGESFLGRAGGGGSSDVKLNLNVVAGQTYFVWVTNAGATSGEYTLTVDDQQAFAQAQTLVLPASMSLQVSGSLDENAIFAGARPISISPNGYKGQSGGITAPGQIDAYSFIAPTSGPLTVQLASTIGSLDGLLYVFDGNHTLLASGGGDALSQVNLPNVTAGQTYYVWVKGLGNTEGPYSLAFFANQSVAPLPAPAAGIPPATDGLPLLQDVYQFVAPTSGLLTVHLTASSGSNLDGILTAFDASMNVLGTDEGGGGTLDSVVQIQVTAGQSYYLWATASPGSTGAYVLSFDTQTPPIDPNGNTISDARLLIFSVLQDQNNTTGQILSPTAEVTGAINPAGDVDFFKIVVPLLPVKNGITYSVNVLPNGMPVKPVNYRLSLFDAQGNPLVTNRVSTLGRTVVPGGTYYLQVTGPPKTVKTGVTGPYDLIIGIQTKGSGAGAGPALPPLGSSVSLAVPSSVSAFSTPPSIASGIGSGSGSGGSGSGAEATGAPGVSTALASTGGGALLGAIATLQSTSTSSQESTTEGGATAVASGAPGGAGQSIYTMRSGNPTADDLREIVAEDESAGAERANVVVSALDRLVEQWDRALTGRQGLVGTLLRQRVRRLPQSRNPFVRLTLGAIDQAMTRLPNVDWKQLAQRLLPTPRAAVDRPPLGDVPPPELPDAGAETAPLPDPLEPALAPTAASAAAAVLLCVSWGELHPSRRPGFRRAKRTRKVV